ncbi:MAG: BON domain-containing protein [Rubrivivax sp.]|nr:BON domain-containing protein [Rubrivivax sp.]
MNTTRHTRINAKARVRAVAVAAAALATLTLLPACAPLLLGGAAVGGAMMAIDRRTTGAQVEDQAIELKALASARELSTLGNISVTSYNRRVLVTGEVASDADRARVTAALQRLDNVREVINELALAGNSSLTARSNDAILSAKVKAALIDAKTLQANAFKVVTERGTVYLMGLVTEREASRGTEVTRGVSGVQKVVQVFETITEGELATLQSKPAPR